MKKETVILTTLSTLPSRKNYSYYYSEKDGKRLYCDGLLSVEAGTKYYLSNNAVDRIIVIASNETRSHKAGEDSIQMEGRLYTEQSLSKKTRSKSAITDAELYYDRISFFWNGFEQKSFGEDISGIRKRELMTIVRKTLKAKGEQCERASWFDVICRKSYHAEVEQAVKRDIEASFLTEEDYRRYSDDAWKEAEQAFQEKLDNRASVDDFLHWLDQNNLKLPWLAREAFCRIYQDRLNRWLIEADLHSSGAAKTMHEQAISYRKAVLKLTEELSALKTNRLRREVAYIQRRLYLDLSPDLKLTRTGIKEAKPPVVTIVPDEDIYEIIRNVFGSGENNIQLLIDVQGGNRTSSYEMNSLLSILKTIEEIDCRFVAVNYHARNYANEIRDETRRYEIADLVSAMNAFITYGRAKQLSDFCGKNIIKEEPEVRVLLNYMTKLEEGLALCNVKEIQNNLIDIKRFFADRRKSGLVFQNAYLRTLQESIERDYEDILVSTDGVIELKSLINWTIKKSFLQQAITLAEALIPHEIVRTGILYYASTERQLEKARKEFSDCFKAADEKARWVFNDISYYYIKYYCTEKRIDAAFPAQHSPGKGGKGEQNAINRNNNSILLTYLDRNNRKTKDQMKKLIDLYKDLCDLRNTIAHADTSTDLKHDLIKKMDIFWKQYGQCKKWVPEDIQIAFLKKEDIEDTKKK